MATSSHPFSGPQDLERLKQFALSTWADESYRSYIHVGDLL
jgi:hypothetical protein